MDQQPVQRVCAWCNSRLGAAEGTSAGGGITHGLCDSCWRALMDDLPGDIASFLDRFNLPVLLIDSRLDSAIANRAAAGLFGIESRLHNTSHIGDLLECANARLPGGCGQTKHCQACTIRRIILSVSSTGEPVDSAPAYLSQEDRRIRLLVSGEMAGKMVLLRIEEFEPDDGRPSLN